MNNNTITKEKVLYGTPINKEKNILNEEILIEGKTDLSNKNILNYAKKNFKNYSNFRILEFNLKDINIKKEFKGVLKND